MARFLNKLHHFVAALRIPLYKLRHNSFGKKNFITEHVLLNGCRIGNYNYIGNFSVLNNVDIGNYCSIAPHCIIGGEEHAFWDYSTSNSISSLHITSRRTILGHDVWIGAGAFIRQGITIGDGAVIGAHSVVLKDVAPYTIMVGTPAKMLRKRFPNSIIGELQRHNYYYLPPENAKKFLADMHNQYPVTHE